MWSPDGRWIAYAAGTGDRVRVLRRLSSGAGGEETVLDLRGEERERMGVFNLEVVDWSRDGRYLLAEVVAPAQRSNLMTLDLEEPKPTLQPVIATPFNEDSGRFSPDGRWIAYTSNESGRNQVYVQPFPPDGAKWQVSTDGGQAPRWRGDSGELFFSNGRSILAVAVTAGAGELRIGAPQPVADEGSLDYVVTSDGKSLIAAGSAAQSPMPIQVVLDWTAALADRE